MIQYNQVRNLHHWFIEFVNSLLDIIDEINDKWSSLIYFLNILIILMNADHMTITNTLMSNVILCDQSQLTFPSFNLFAFDSRKFHKKKLKRRNLYNLFYKQVNFFLLWFSLWVLLSFELDYLISPEFPLLDNVFERLLYISHYLIAGLTISRNRKGSGQLGLYMDSIQQCVIPLQ